MPLERDSEGLLWVLPRSPILWCATVRPNTINNVGAVYGGSQARMVATGISERGMVLAHGPLMDWTPVARRTGNTRLFGAVLRLKLDRVSDGFLMELGCLGPSVHANVPLL